MCNATRVKPQLGGSEIPAVAVPGSTDGLGSVAGMSPCAIPYPVREVRVLQPRHGPPAPVLAPAIARGGW